MGLFPLNFWTDNDIEELLYLLLYIITNWDISNWYCNIILDEKDDENNTDKLVYLDITELVIRAFYSIEFDLTELYANSD